VIDAVGMEAHGTPLGKLASSLRACSQDDSDPLGVEDLGTRKLPLDQAPHGYKIFQKKQEGDQDPAAAERRLTGAGGAGAVRRRRSGVRESGHGQRRPADPA
jgi:hypothetical protein